MAVKTDGIRVSDSHIYEFLNARNEALGRRISGTSDIESDIREEHRIPIARIEWKTRTMIDDDLVELMEPLGEETIKIYDHRISFSLFVIARLDEDSLKRHAIDTPPLHEFGVTPGKFFDLRIRICDFVR
jgi:hypothetical protein